MSYTIQNKTTQSSIGNDTTKTKQTTY